MVCLVLVISINIIFKWFYLCNTLRFLWLKLKFCLMFKIYIFYQSYVLGFYYFLSMFAYKCFVFRCSTNISYLTNRLSSKFMTDIRLVLIDKAFQVLFNREICLVLAISTHFFNKYCLIKHRCILYKLGTIYVI